MNTKRFVTIFILVLGLLLILSVGLSAAQEAQDESPPLEPPSVNSALEYKIPIQGRLTNAGGSPLNGDYNLTLRVYDVQTGGTPICDDSHLESVDNGLFNTAIEGCTPKQIDGQQLYLGIEVENDGEMTPRQPLYPVPYAYSLVPGAMMRGNIPSWSMLRVFNEGDTNSTALAGIAESKTGTNTGVLGWSNSPDGTGGRFRNDDPDGVALAATGSGIFRSSAETYLFIPGNAIVRESLSDTTEIKLYPGVASIKKGGANVADDRTVILPITIPGVMYGQRVLIKEVRVSYVCWNAASYIDRTRLYRVRTGSVDTLVDNDTPKRTSIVPTYYTRPVGTFNRLSEESGPLTLMLDLQFANNTDYINIDYVRLTLWHQ